jgi:serine/threonine protein kinase
MPIPVGGNYVIGEPLRSGQYGTVYRAKVARTGEPRAVKIIPFRGLDSCLWKRAVANEAESHARACRASSSHIVRFHSFELHIASDGPRRPQALARTSLRAPDMSLASRSSHDDCAWIVMELCENRTLRTVLSGRTRDLTPWSSRLEVTALLHVARALHACHSIGVCHGDVKPENVLLSGSASWKLADFGCAVQGPPPASLSNPTSKISMSRNTVDFVREAMVSSFTPHYAAPEVIERGVLCPASDIFALGRMAVEMQESMLARRSAIHGKAMDDGRNDGDDECLLGELSRRTLALEPADRPRAGELVKLIEEVLRI